MAKAGDKRRLEANTKKLRLLRTVILAAVAFHVAVRLLLFRASVTKWTLFGFVVSALIELVCYRALSQMAVPTYGAGGELIDGGGDLALGGVTAYYFDAIYIAVVVQFLTVLSSKFWLVFLVVPAYAGWQLWVTILQPYVMASSSQQAPVETEAERARRERTEKRSQRRSQRYA